MILRSLALTLAIALAAMAPGAALAQSGFSGGAPSNPAPIRVDLAAQGGASQTLALPQGKSAIIELPVDVRDILVTNPSVADAMLRSPRRIFILGVKTGATDAVFFDAAGRRILSLAIRVDQDTSAVAQTINRVLPGASVRVDAINSSLILSGQVANIGDADKAMQIAKASVDKPDTQVLNMLSIAGKDQVMLKVRVVEIQRNSIKQLGFNLSAVLGQVGETQYLLSNAASFGVNGALLGGISGGYKTDTTKQPILQLPCTGAGWTAGALCPVVARDSTVAANADAATITNTAGSPGLNSAEGAIKAFERVGLARTLAEPNLTAVSGESAKFLAGGEYPIPVSQDDKGHVTVEYKPFGVGLGFTPVVLSGGRISLKISTEVSELSTTGAFSLASTSTSTSLTIPALNVRRAETSVELPSGGSMMIAGLLKEETKQALDSLPGVTTLPVLGALFRSRDYLSGETELVIIVTPYIVQPVSPDKLQTPADGLKIANDAQTILLGQLTKAYKAKPQPPTGRAYQGPIGYVIE
ncbi:type II and III secretion system protein family protein [Phenylobacterium aquaticum]|uniref:type II and III secretion system protein family protein n=1 Tax=Phenylobacterium aquaticum TaxID=1763816 RepID=UPI0026ED1546|nr:type II and III secretion system protein family protein [Phenylobacterium aquaticum]